jgi:Fe-S-cluster-containing hydrogenase component 2
MTRVDGVRRPVVAEEQCIGCGKCEYLCPSRPVSAITVKGLETHISK